MEVSRGRLAAVLAALLIAGTAIAATEFSATMNLPEGRAETVTPSFSFNDRLATAFLENLSTPSGLLRTYPTSHTIYLADDQQLDYGALMMLGDYALAERINSTMNVVAGGLYGGFNSTTCSYGHWNGVDVVLGVYLPIPCGGSEWNMNSGQDVSLGDAYPGLPNDTCFTIVETNWSGPMGDGYTQYADLELDYSLNQLHFGDYASALKAFGHANSTWDGFGFADRAYQSSSEYTSFKLALYLIVFRALMDNPHTEASAAAYSSTVDQVENMMSGLQGSDGGVITNYQISNGAISIPPNTFENGETTSLFVLAG